MPLGPPLSTTVAIWADVDTIVVLVVDLVSSALKKVKKTTDYCFCHAGLAMWTTALKPVAVGLGNFPTDATAS
jgi:hypothetical protein